MAMQPYVMTKQCLRNIHHNRHMRHTLHILHIHHTKI